jgi:hypothetical protein
MRGIPVFGLAEHKILFNRLSLNRRNHIVVLKFTIVFLAVSPDEESGTLQWCARHSELSDFWNVVREGCRINIGLVLHRTGLERAHG